MIVIDVGWIVTYRGQSGGNWVREQVQAGLADRCSFDTVYIDSGLGFAQFPRAVWKLATYEDRAIDVWIETIGSHALRIPGRRRPNVLALHHLADPARLSRTARVVTAAKNTLALRRMRTADRIVVVSDFWADYLGEHGIETNVRTVYNGLPVERFDLDPERIESIRRRLTGGDGPLVHVGPCAPGKGGDTAYRRLSGDDYTLITTGRKIDDTPVTHLNPSYDEYLHVLGACDVVVAMSETVEGWNLQVQEAMMCGTPVVGSGRGGMGMLIEDGGQIECPDFESLPSCVVSAIEDQERIGPRGREYAAQFTRERMVEGWHAVLEEIT